MFTALNRFQHWFAALGRRPDSPGAAAIARATAATARISGFDGTRLALTVGAVAALLPAVLYAVQSVVRQCHFDSISHHYFAPFAGEIFVGSLFSIGFLMIAYSGKTRSEGSLASVGGASAIAVALFPTSGDACEQAGGFVRPIMSAQTVLCETRADCVITEGTAEYALFASAEVLHFASAGLLFVILAFFCWAIFPRVDPEHYVPLPDGTPGTRLKATNRIRDPIYYVSGAVILACVLMMGLKPWILPLVGTDVAAWDAVNGTFWVEAIALWAFALSWLVRARVIESVLAVFGAYPDASANRAT